jgi:large subunit ribosomal protein L13
MNCKMQKTFVAKGEEVKDQRQWYLIDAQGKTLGKLAVAIANILRGKNKSSFTPHVDTGDYVVVVNARNVAFSGKKLKKKVYYHYSGYPGGLKRRTLEEMLERNPEEVISHAVRGMLPKNRLAKAMIKKLKVFAGPVHTHASQKPIPLEVK